MLRRLRTVAQMSEAIRSARTRLELSQEEVAELAGITVHTYGAMERGVAPSGAPVNPTLDTYLRVAWVLQIDTELGIPSPNIERR
ncbi:helix-turn-helix transcriptional regulator [Microbacterium hominis]|uniref:HTH cro/C1-type domain-containing protein n=1 Tax=Microbacterium hominis TaxID=162426 RepID=A0A0B4D152_9MICO|nr:hypothetical protein RM52_06725 [Microbacterium hominis]